MKKGVSVGVIRLSPPPYHDCDLAIWIYSPFRNKGYGTKAFILGLRYCFSLIKLQTVGAGCYCDNYASQRMLQKIGFDRDVKNDINEINAFTGNLTLQLSYFISSEKFHSLYD